MDKTCGDVCRFMQKIMWLIILNTRKKLAFVRLNHIVLCCTSCHCVFVYSHPDRYACRHSKSFPSHSQARTDKISDANARNYRRNDLITPFASFVCGLCSLCMLRFVCPLYSCWYFCADESPLLNAACCGLSFAWMQRWVPATPTAPLHHIVIRNLKLYIVLLCAFRIFYLL